MSPSPEHRSPEAPEMHGSSPLHDTEKTQPLTVHELPPRNGWEGRERRYAVDETGQHDEVFKDEIFGDTQHSNESEGRPLTHLEQVLAAEAAREAEANETLVARGRVALGSIALRLSNAKGLVTSFVGRFQSSDSDTYEGRHEPGKPGRHRQTREEQPGRHRETPAERLMGTEDLHVGDNGDDIYLGRHRSADEDEQTPRSNRFKRAAYRVGTRIDNKLHDRREGDVEEYVSPAAPTEGENVVFGTHMWQVKTSEGEYVTLRRIDTAGQEEVQKVAVADLDYWNKPDVETTDDQAADKAVVADAPQERQQQPAPEREPKERSLRRRLAGAALTMATLVSVSAGLGAAHDHLAGDKAQATAAADRNPGAKKAGEGAKQTEPKFSVAAEHASQGEGWSHTMKEMGIPSEKWDKALNIAGPKLVKMGEAYYDSSTGTYGISHEGKLKESALNVLATTAKSIK